MSGLEDIFQNADQDKSSVKQDHKPLVMAYIGKDDPMRGDSRGAVGVARITAELLGGRYIYLDDEVLKKCFVQTRTLADYFNFGRSHAIHDFISQNGEPDIVIGSDAKELLGFMKNKPVVFEDRYNEQYSRIRGRKPYSGLSCHDLDQQTLAREAASLRAQFNMAKQPLIALYIGAYSNAFIDKDVEKVARAVNSYQQASVFICPCRHVSDDLYERFASAFRDEVAPHIDVLGQSYGACRNSYNPYRGLIGAADHHIMLGESQSMVSEILQSGKMMYSDSPYMNDSWKKGLIANLNHVGDGALATVAIDPPDITRPVAEDIAREYRERMQARQMSL